jgi:hypothetical protein
VITEVSLRKQSPAWLVLSGMTIFVLGAVLGWYGFPALVRSQIISVSTLFCFASFASGRILVPNSLQERDIFQLSCVRRYNRNLLQRLSGFSHSAYFLIPSLYCSSRIYPLPSSLADMTNHLVFLRSVRRLLVTPSVVPSSPILVTLMKKTLSSSETSVLTRATRRNIPEDTILYSHCSESLKSYMTNLLPSNICRQRHFLFNETVY